MELKNALLFEPVNLHGLTRVPLSAFPPFRNFLSVGGVNFFRPSAFFVSHAPHADADATRVYLRSGDNSYIANETCKAGLCFRRPCEASALENFAPKTSDSDVHARNQSVQRDPVELMFIFRGSDVDWSPKHYRSFQRKDTRFYSFHLLYVQTVLSLCLRRMS